MTPIPVEVDLQLPDGRIFTLHRETESRYMDSEPFWWLEGNASCDCNRAIFLNYEYNLDLDEDSCGHSIILLSLKISGNEITIGAVND